jgi:hypothetical protein
MLASHTVYEDPNYDLAMKWINKVRVKTNTHLGSVNLGVKTASMYFDKINEMLISEYVNIDILKELKERINTDRDIIINDCKNRFAPNREDVTDNKYMILMISDFILTLKTIS